MSAEPTCFEKNRLWTDYTGYKKAEKAEAQKEGRAVDPDTPIVKVLRQHIQLDAFKAITDAKLKKAVKTHRTTRTSGSTVSVHSLKAIFRLFMPSDGVKGHYLCSAMCRRIQEGTLSAAMVLASQTAAKRKRADDMEFGFAKTRLDVAFKRYTIHLQGGDLAKQAEAKQELLQCLEDLGTKAEIAAPYLQADHGGLQKLVAEVREALDSAEKVQAKKDLDQDTLLRAANMIISGGKASQYGMRVERTELYDPTGKMADTKSKEYRAAKCMIY